MINDISEKKNSAFGVLMVITAGICWGIISIFVKKLSSDGFNSFEIIFVRAWIAVIVMFIFLLIFDRKLLKINLKDIWMFVGTGIVSLTFFSFCYFTTILNCGAAVGVVLLYTSPIFVMILSAIFFKEKITAIKIIAVILTFSGCVLTAGLIGNGQSISFISLLTGIGAGIGYALYSVFAGFAVKKYSSITVTFYTLLFSGISLFFFRNMLKPEEIIYKINTGNIIYIIGIAVISTFIPYLTYTIGLTRMEKGKAAVLVTVEPLVGTLLGIFAFNEPVNILNISGIILIFISVILLSVPVKKPRV